LRMKHWLSHHLSNLKSSLVMPKHVMPIALKPFKKSFKRWRRRLVLKYRSGTIVKLKCGEKS
jgi:hypothetical protein